IESLKKQAKSYTITCITYTTLFRSRQGKNERQGDEADEDGDGGDGHRLQQGGHPLHPVAQTRFVVVGHEAEHGADGARLLARAQERKSTRLNSRHVKSSYAVFCVQK